MKKILLFCMCAVIMLGVFSGCTISDYMAYKTEDHVRSDDLEYWEFEEAEEKAEDYNMEVDSYLAMEYYGLEYNEYQIISLLAGEKRFETYMNELLAEVGGDMSKLEEKVNALITDYSNQVMIDLEEEETKEDAQPNAWVGTWSGQMTITTIDMPDAYSAEEQAQLIGTSGPITFTVGIDEMNHYTVAVQDGGSDLRTTTITINNNKITIVLKSVETDDDEVVYQKLVGELSADQNSAQGTFKAGIESMGSYYSGTWSVTRK